jgi:hypothetical protein
MNTIRSFPLPFVQSGLFQSPLSGSAKTSTLCYQATYYPPARIQLAHKLSWQKQFTMTKQDLLDRFDAETNRITVGSMTFPIAWQYNEVPTKVEWDKLDDSSVFVVDCRVGSLIPNGRCATICPVSVFRKSALPD